jgi:TonB family protein
MVYTEENNYPKAFAATGVILAVVMALCYFIVFQNPMPQDTGTGGILVNYGTTDEGSGKDITSAEEVSKSEKANHTKPDKVTTAQPTEDKTKADNSDKKIVTQTTEDAPELATNKKASNTVATQPAKTTKKQVVNQAALYSGKTNNASGSGDGTTGTPGNQGSPNGSTLSTDYGPGGSGNGLSIAHWSYVNPPDVKNVHRVPGIVVIDFTVDQNGNVIEAHSDRSKTKAGLDMVQSCIDAIKRTKFTSPASVSGNTSGHTAFIFKVD